MLVVATSCGSSKDARRGGSDEKWVEVSEIIRMLEQSPVAYQIADLDKVPDIDPKRLAEAQWPQLIEPVSFPKLDANGQVVPYEMERGCLDLLSAAEPLFEKKDYAEARKHYEAARAQYPGCYMATVYLGDATLFGGDPVAAEKLYLEVIEKNPVDYRGHFFRASALLAQERVDEAIESYSWALTLRPRHESILTALHNNARHIGATVHDQPFALRALARKEKDGFGIFFDADKPYWLSYAAVKAAWMGEPEVRRRMGANPERYVGWSSDEERHALLSLLATYLYMRSEGKVERDDELERLHNIGRAKLLTGFILYEVASRMHPHLILTLPKAVQQQVQDYVKRFIMGVGPREIIPS
ncbi:MAG: tetratricopeptide repeat protein [Myxococcota bacterium]